MFYRIVNNGTAQTANQNLTMGANETVYFPAISLSAVVVNGAITRLRPVNSRGADATIDLIVGGTGANGIVSAVLVAKPEILAGSN